MGERLYTELHYEAFFQKLSDAQIHVLYVLTENDLIPKKGIIEKLSEHYSKNPVVNAIDSLQFAGLIDFQYLKKQHKYFLSDDGIAFNEFVVAKRNRN